MIQKKPAGSRRNSAVLLCYNSLALVTQRVLLLLSFFYTDVLATS